MELSDSIPCHKPNVNIFLQRFSYFQSHAIHLYVNSADVNLNIQFNCLLPTLSPLRDVKRKRKESFIFYSFVTCQLIFLKFNEEKWKFDLVFIIMLQL